MSDSNLTRVANRERTAANRVAFRETIVAYRELEYRHPVQAMNLDSHAKRSMALNPASIDFRVDCENAVLAAIGASPNLHSTFVALVNDEPVDDPKLAEEVIDRCGRIFTARQLAPYLYFAPKVRVGSIPRRAA